MVSFIRRLWLTAAGHCGIAIPVEAVAYIAKGRAPGFNVSITCEDDMLKIKPIEEEA